MAVSLTRKQKRSLHRMMALRPVTAAQLHRFVDRALGLDVPRAALSDKGRAPFEYLLHAFFEADDLYTSPADAAQVTKGKTPSAQNTAMAEPLRPGADCVVWANRGGGKTMLGAVATLLDLVFKPGIQVRILGGSLEQSSRMYAHLVALCERPLIRPLLASEPTQRRVRLINESGAEVLAQSQRSVRGVRVHKLRCDEVEEFDPEVWQAAQLVTRSGMCGHIRVNGAVEALSTMHRPGGLMAQLIDGKQLQEPPIHTDTISLPAEPNVNSSDQRRRVFRWNFLDVIECCPPGRKCGACVLWPDCRGRAKRGQGFMKVDDLVAQWHRTSTETWAAEMACGRPRRSDSVYPNFDTQKHVCERAGAGVTGATHIAGMDFGLRSPLAMVWARLEESAEAPIEERTLHVIDEYVEQGRTLEQHLAAMASRGKDTSAQPAFTEWVGVDPAGRQRNSHSGLTDIDLLRAHGYRVRSRPSGLHEGIERVRRRLDRNTLLIHPRCMKLIAALRGYHFDSRRPQSAEPVKDGPDHVCDALRYMIVNLERGPQSVRVRRYA